MSGFYGDLSASQQQALAGFKGQVGGDDHTALRFLRARQFSVKDAVELYQSSVAYRKEIGLDKLLNAQLPTMELWRTFVPHSYHGFDKLGRPIYLEKTACVDFDVTYKHLTDEDVMRHHLWQMEHLIEKCKEGTRQTGNVVDSVCAIFDLGGLNMSHRKGMKFIRMCAAQDQALYPERLGKVYVINAPWIFWTFWKIVKIWLDPNTLKKIEVCGKNYQKVLLDDIPAENLPAEYGGKCKCLPDGKCIHVADLTPYRNGADPIDQALQHADTKEQLVAARDVYELRVNCDEKGADFNWAFRTQSKDIIFSVSIISSESDAADVVDPEETKRADSVAERVLHEPEKVSSAQGSHVVRGAATLIFRWDNTHSRFTSKTIKFNCRPVPLDEEENAALEENEKVSHMTMPHLHAPVDQQLVVEPAVQMTPAQTVSPVN